MRFNNETTFSTTSFPSDLMDTTRFYEPNNTRRQTKCCNVTDDICLFVIGGIRNMTTEEQCAAEKATHVAVVHNIDILKPCLTRKLSRSVNIMRNNVIKYKILLII